jgi:hypothetical protein
MEARVKGSPANILPLFGKRWNSTTLQTFSSPFEKGGRWAVNHIN